MTENYEEKKRQSQELFKQSSQASDETTPSSISETVQAFSKRLGGIPQFVPVKEDQYGLFGWCSDGVVEKAKRDGGTIRFGWVIWEWPDIFLTAEFHAVWVSQDGNLVDITPKPQGERQIVFVGDESFGQDFDFDDRPPNRRFRIAQEPDYAEQARAQIARFKDSQLKYEKNRAAKMGQSLVEWIVSKQPRPRLPSLVDELIEVCDAVDRKTDTLAKGGGIFHPDREYIELMRKKIGLLESARDERRKLL